MYTPFRKNLARHCLHAAASTYPNLQGLIWRESDQINPIIHIFHQEDLLHQDELQRRVSDGDCIDVIPGIEDGRTLPAS